MSTLIVYATKHGCTEKCANILLEKLTGEIELYNLKTGQEPNLSKYDKVVIGGSIYIGKIQKEVSEFCLKNLSQLKDKKVGLFICGMQESDAIASELSTSFPEELSNIAVARECFGGEFIFKKMNVMERFIVKKIAKTDKDVIKIQHENIDRFAQLMNNA